jgi:transmembrane sensor
MKYLAYSIEDLITDESFINYVEGSNEQAVLLWQKLILTYPQISKNVEEAKMLYLLLALKRSNDEKAFELDRLKLVIDQKSKAEIDKVVVRKSNQKSYWLAIAASVLVFMGLYVTFIKFRTPAEIIAFGASQEYYEVAAQTNYGERKLINLLDGSSVILNGASVLSIAKDYNKENRVLKINGEAFFEVAKDKSRPFIVISGNSITTALGTSFKVKNYNGRPDMSIMLSTGKVSVKEISNNEEITKEMLLLPGEVVRIYDYKASEKTQFEEQELNNWKDGKLSFSMANMNEVKEKLYDMYGVSVVATNLPSNKNLAFTGSFQQENLKSVLEAISFVNHFTYEIKDDKIYITY